MDGLILWLEFLHLAKAGIYTNRVIFRKPTLTTFSNLSEIGIGGFCPYTGIVWHYFSTEEERQATTPNAKEYIASAIGMDIQAEYDLNLNQFPCTLNGSDIIYTVRWLRTSNHNREDALIHKEVV